MSKRFGIILAICCGITACLSIVAIILTVVLSRPKAVERTPDTQYVLYLGTNDKDTNLPIYSKEESKEKLIEILIKNFGGYTIQEANGGWEDNGTLYVEYTLVIYLSDTDINKVHKACDEMITVFHQSSVLIQSNRTQTEFYSG